MSKSFQFEGYQQGDVILRKIDAVPTDAKPVAPKGGRYIVAEGEHTGHAHAIVADPEVRLLERNGVLYLVVESGATVTHEEHHAQVVAPGVYEVGIVKEVDPFTDEIRSVAD
jgi:hypothetical protein